MYVLPMQTETFCFMFVAKKGFLTAFLQFSHFSVTGNENCDEKDVVVVLDGRADNASASGKEITAKQ